MATARYYMACLDLTGRSVLVVGGGPVALEKVEGLLAAGARVTVVAPEIVPELAELDAHRRPPRVPQPRISTAGSSSSPRRRRRRSTAASSATPRHGRCSATSSTCPELCSFILPAVHRHEPIAIAVSTGGASPALAQRLRDEIAAVVRPEHAELARRLRELRPWAKSHFADLRGAQGVLRRARRGGARMTVHLVGAGPGDPELITVRGLELVRSCDVLVADALVAQELVDEAPDDALVISRAGMSRTR